MHKTGITQGLPPPPPPWSWGQESRLSSTTSMRLSLLALILSGLATALLNAAVLPELETAAQRITAAGLLKPIRVLASDSFGGRLPGTPGDKKSVKYLIAQCRALKLAPGNPNGTYVQQVPLWGTRSKGKLTIDGLTLEAGKDYVAWSALPDAQVTIRAAAMVFAGYGVVAPEHQWDDYAGVDVRGKVVVVLGGDPAVADPSSGPSDPGKLDEKYFLGRALTVHGRTGTKLDRAFANGAAALIILNSSTALFQNYARENMILRDAHDRQRVKAQALLSLERAKELFPGQDFDALRAAAARPGFRAVALAAKASFDIANTVRRIDSPNVIAKIPGRDPKLSSEYVVYSAHWDHHGQEGDRIFHGASDNAAGTAGVLELARALRTVQPRRTILFLWPTAEEKGLLGAKYYVEHPLYPLARTVANINLDYFSNWGWGRTRDLSIVGLGNSTLDDLTTEAVQRQGRVVTGDTLPEQGFYFRSDHYEFARAGVPSLETAPGIDYRDRPAEYGLQKRADYIAHDYHQASDIPKPDWDLSGAVEDLQVLLEVGYRVAQSSDRPTWKPDAIWRPR